MILQHDDMLIFPGDTAFEVACLANGKAAISLADPDPAAKELPKHRKSTVKSMNNVRFTVEDVRPKKKKDKKKKSKGKKKKEEL